MSDDSGSVIPITKEQAKAIEETAKFLQEATKALTGVGGFLKETFGTVPQDLVGMLGGDFLRTRTREEQADKLFREIIEIADDASGDYVTTSDGERIVDHA
jgi:hypothetical protein